MCNESVPGQEWKMAKMAVKMQFTFTFSDKSQQNVLLQRFTSNINMCVSIKLSPSCSITKDDIKKLTFLTINDEKKNEKGFQNIREDICSKKTFSFGHCPNPLNPPPPMTPIRATWSFFFGRQKRRFSAYYRTK